MNFRAINPSQTGAAFHRAAQQIPACLLAFLSLFLTASTAFADTDSTIPVELVRVKDGDSIVVMTDGQKIEVRLYGIDTPECKQPYSREATKALQEMLDRSAVSIRPMDEDRYDRIVAVVYADGINVDEALIKVGLAWVYTEYCKESFCESWKQSEAQARKDRQGLWQEPDPQPPWEYRNGYTGNVRTMKFHRKSCKHFCCKNCTRHFNSREEAIQAGFSPCGGCKP